MIDQRKMLIAATEGISIRCMGDVANAVGATFGSDGLMLAEDDLSADFFDLKTGLAGELFQKFENYKMRLIIIVSEPERYGERFTELSREHRFHNSIRILPTRKDADSWLRDLEYDSIE
jgi:hypothetical protein